MALHPYNTGLHNHAVTAKTYATEAARDADAAWIGNARNIHKVVWIEDVEAFQILASVGPAVWHTMGSQALAAEAGVGITGTAEFYSMNVTRFGNGVVKTEILIDLTDLVVSTTDDDIIGADGVGVAHIGQILAARNGTVYKGVMTCLEVPAGGDLSVALWAADTGTGVEDTSITAQTNQNELEQSQGDGTDWATGDEIAIADGLPTADQYLYLVGDGGGSPGTYTGGKFLIEFWGFAT